MMLKPLPWLYPTQFLGGIVHRNTPIIRTFGQFKYWMAHGEWYSEIDNALTRRFERISWPIGGLVAIVALGLIVFGLTTIVPALGNDRVNPLDLLGYVVAVGVGLILVGVAWHVLATTAHHKATIQDIDDGELDLYVRREDDTAYMAIMSPTLEARLVDPQFDQPEIRKALKKYFNAVYKIELKFARNYDNPGVDPIEYTQAFYLAFVKTIEAAQKWGAEIEKVLGTLGIASHIARQREYALKVRNTELNRLAQTGADRSRVLELLQC